MHLLRSVFGRYASAEIPKYEVFFSSILVIETFFLDVFKSFLHSVNERQAIAH